MSARVNTVQNNIQDNVSPQINLGKSPNFLINYNVATNLNDIIAIQLRAGDTLVFFMNEEVSYGKEFWKTAEEKLRDNKQFFRNNDFILNLDYLARVNGSENDTAFIFNKGTNSTLELKLGADAWNEFNKHINK